MKVFVSKTTPKDKKWLVNYYYGERDGTGKHAHFTLSGVYVWFLRNLNGEVIVKNGEIIENN
jgi:hypothetical protein